MPIVKSVVVPIKVTGVDGAKLQIGEVGVAAEKLKTLNPTIEVQIDKAKALLEARLLRAGINAELSKGVETGTRGGILGNLFGSVSKGAAGGTGFFGTIGGALSGLASAGPAGIAVLAGLAAAAATLAVALGGAIAAIAAASIGFSAFGALAAPTIAKVIGGITAVSGAATAVARDKAWDAIPKAMQPVVSGALALKAAFTGAASGIQGTVLQVLSDALKAAKPLLQALTPLAKTSGQAIDGLLKSFAQFANSAGFKQFMAQMQTLAGPAITAIGKGIGAIVISIGKLLQSMANPAGVATLTVLLKGVALAIGLIGLAFEGVNKTLIPFISNSLRAASVVVGAFRWVANAVLASMGVLIDGAAKAFGWLPGGIGKSLRDTAKNFDTFRAGVSKNLGDAQAALNRWSTAVQNAPKIFALKANITDLENKLATAKASLADPHLTATKRANIDANIANLLAQIAAAKNALAAINGTVATTYINTVVSPTTLHHFASGGVVGAGGTPGGSQLVMVGEMGRELVSLPAGSRVYPNQATERMVGSQGGNTYNITVQVPPAANLAEVGRVTVLAIEAFEKGSGKSWRTR